MSLATWSLIAGMGGAVITTLSFWPQLVKVRRQGGQDLSLAMLGMYLGGACLWLVYGILNRATAVIAANIVALALVSAIAVLKMRSDRSLTATSRKLRIAIDMDEVMADALGEHLRRYNAAFEARVTADALRGRHLEECVPPEHRDAAIAMLDAGFFENLAVLPDCREVIAELAARHEVFVVTAAMEVPCSFDAKYQWLRRHFPFIPPSHIVFCGDKAIVDADFLIDDRSRHFERFKGQSLLFSAPHNATEKGYRRLASWSEVRDFFTEIDGTSDHSGAPRSQPLLDRAVSGI
ncbi:MAG TPA: PQ-loop domain-containing transporter [Vicinamibacterales bacterium]